MVGVFGMLCLVDGMRLGHIVQSYCNDVTLSFTADRNAIPDPDFYTECMQKSFEDHLKLALALKASQEDAATVNVKETKTVNRKAKPKAKSTVKSKTIRTNGVQKTIN